MGRGSLAKARRLGVVVRAHHLKAMLVPESQGLCRWWWWGSLGSGLSLEEAQDVARGWVTRVSFKEGAGRWRWERRPP